MRDEWAIHPLLRSAIHRLARLGAPHTFTRACASGDCCRQYLAERAAPVPPRIGFVSLYTRSDGIVDWRTCLDPQAEAVEVEGSHAGMGASAPAYRAIAAALADFRG